MRGNNFEYDIDCTFNVIIVTLFASFFMICQFAFLKLDYYNIFEMVHQMRHQKDELHNILDEMFEAVIMIREGKI